MCRHQQSDHVTHQSCQSLTLLRGAFGVGGGCCPPLFSSSSSPTHVRVHPREGNSRQCPQMGSAGRDPVHRARRRTARSRHVRDKASLPLTTRGRAGRCRVDPMGVVCFVGTSATRKDPVFATNRSRVRAAGVVYVVYVV